MLRILPIACLLFLVACNKGSTTDPTPITPDSATVTVVNGYGAGKYKVGDTVHLFSTAYGTNQIFDTWTSTDAGLLNAQNEWHTWFIMPAKNVSFTGNLRTITPVTLQFEMIRGRDRLKPVYYYFPAGHKGFVYILHGTGGSAQYTANNFEHQLLIRELINDNFGVIITECEESTTGIDANGDGKIRWNSTPVDTINNVDYANIRILTDTFYNRGVTSRAKLRYSSGMSNGGGFSAALSYVYNYKAGISYCAPGGTTVAQLSTVPFQFCMARFDNNENVGPQGNADALANSNTLKGRGICSKYFMKERSPLYPERFARRGDITIAKSTAIFNELKSKGYIDARNFYIGFSGPLVTAFQSNPASFPQLQSCTLLQLQFVVEQIDLAVSDHQMYSDYNKATLRFLNQQCQ